MPQKLSQRDSSALYFIKAVAILSSVAAHTSTIDLATAWSGCITRMWDMFSCISVGAFLMVGGVLVIVLIEYIPVFAGIGPGADLLFSSTFGGPFMSILIVFVPQVLVFSLLCTYIYRRTGNVYTGAFTVASMAAWIITGGSAML